MFSSFQDDAQHSYYASHCQYLVSSDKQLLLKSRVLYNMLGIETKVIDYEEFKKIINLRFEEKLDKEYFIDRMSNLFENVEVIFDVPLEEKKIRVVMYKLKESLLHYFNRLELEVNDKDEKTYTLFNECSNYSRFISFVEFSILINYLVGILGIDDFGRDEFTDKEIDLISNGNWYGRTWHLNGSYFGLELIPSRNKIRFVMSHLN